METSEIEARVSRLLKEELPEFDFNQSETLAEDGLLDSLTLTRIISALSMEFGFVIPYDDITRSNFNSPATMAALVAKLLQEDE